MSQAWFAARNRPRQLPKGEPLLSARPMQSFVAAVPLDGARGKCNALRRHRMDTCQEDTLLPPRDPACGSKPNHRTKKIMIDLPGNFCHRVSRASCDAVTVPKMFSRRLEATALKQPPKYQQNDMAGPIVNMPIGPGRSSAIVRLRLR
jgi:hypothetical protein